MHVFIQVIHGKCSRQDEMRSLAESWRDEGGREATGWLGGTFGVTDENDFLAVVRFESRDAAMANSTRPETSAFAEKMGALMDGPVDFHDCDDVTTLLDGGSDDAGFVQVIRGHVDDSATFKGLFADSGQQLREARPEIIGGTFALEPDGTFWETIAFTDEDRARKGEQVPPPAEIQEALASMMAGATFYDLREPWFESP
jgi:hypothetical protein